MKKILVGLALCLGGLLQVTGCGSGSTVTLPQQRMATVIFSASTSAALTTTVRVIKNSAVLPAGVTVPLQLNSKRDVDPAALVGYKPGSSLFGTYSAPLLTVSVIGDIAPASPSLGINNVGDFIGVKVTYPAGLSLTEGSFRGLNPTFPDFAAFGSISNNQIDLSSSLKPTIRVTF